MALTKVQKQTDPLSNGILAVETLTRVCVPTKVVIVSGEASVVVIVRVCVWTEGVHDPNANEHMVPS